MTCVTPASGTSATGSGPKAGAVVISEPSAALAWALRMHVATRSLPVGDLVQNRLLLETQSAIGAASAPDGPERTRILERAEELLDVMDDPELPARDFHAHYAEFHVLLASLAGNMVVETIMAALRQATIGYVQETVSGLGNWPETSRARTLTHLECPNPPVGTGSFRDSGWVSRTRAGGRGAVAGGPDAPAPKQRKPRILTNPGFSRGGRRGT